MRSHKIIIAALAVLVFQSACTTRPEGGQPAAQSSSSKIEKIDLNGRWFGATEADLVPTALAESDFGEGLKIGIYDCDNVSLRVAQTAESLKYRLRINCYNPYKNFWERFYLGNSEDGDGFANGEDLVVNGDKVLYPYPRTNSVEGGGTVVSSDPVEVATISGNQIQISAVDSGYEITGTLTQIDKDTLDYVLSVQSPMVPIAKGQISGRLHRR